MDYKREPLIVPGQVRGMVSAQDRTAVGGGYLPLIQNMRMGDGILRVRWGDESVAGSLTGLQRGVFSCTINQVPYLFRSAYVSGFTRTAVYASVNDGASWTEITAASGPFGNTRFSGDVGPIRFGVIKDRGYDPSEASHGLFDLLVMQDGVSAPRLWGKAPYNSTAATPGVAEISTINQPDAIPNTVDEPFVAGLGNSYDTSSTGTVVNGTGISISFGAAPTGRMLVQVTNAYVAGQQATITYAAPAIDLSGVPQLVLLVGEDTTDFWRTVTMEIGDGTNWLTVLDPGIDQTQNVFLQTVGPTTTVETVYQIACNISQASTLVDLSAITQLRFTWNSTVPATTQSGHIYLFAASGTTPGGSFFALAYEQTDSRTIGPSTIMTNRGAQNASDYDGPTGYTYQDDPRFFFDYQIDAPNPSAPQAALGIDRIVIYRSLPGETQYYWIGSERMVRWNSPTPNVWNFVSGAAGDIIALTVPQGGPEIEDLTITAPGADAVCLPVGLPMVAANSRFFVGATSTLWISDFEFPFIFRASTRYFDPLNPDPTSGTSVSFDGDQVMALVPLGSIAGGVSSLNSPVIGSTTIHVLTVYNQFQLSGFDVTSLSHAAPVSAHGCSAPLSIGRDYMGFYWLDQNAQVCRWTPSTGTTRLSVSVVDNYLLAIPHSDLKWVTGACYNDRYYLSFTNTGDSSALILVFFEKANAWESLDRQAVSVSGERIALLPYVPYLTDTGMMLYRFDANSVEEYEVDGDLSTSAIAVQFPTIHNNGMGSVSVGEMAIWCQGQSGSYTLLTTRADVLNGDTSNGTIVVNATKVWLETAENLGITSYGGVDVGFSGTVPGGTKFTSALINVTRGLDFGGYRA